jgi:ornithine carbamoyltransferase
VRELGGAVIEPHADVAFGGRETIEDVARNFERWLSGAVVRTFGQDRLDRLAAAAPKLHVVNALTDEEHPCQALADMMTLRERLGDVRGPHADVRRGTATTWPRRWHMPGPCSACTCGSHRRRDMSCRPRW